MILEQEFIITAAHPALPGHFPGHAVVPGVVLLDEVLSMIQAGDSGLVVSEIVHWKFLATLLPGQACQVRISMSDPGLSAIECRVDGKTIGKGKCIVSRSEDVG